MSAHVVSRSVDDGVVADFLTSATDGPSALIIESEAGIGKDHAVASRRRGVGDDQS